MISSADHHPRFLKTTIPPPSNHSELRVAPPGSRLQLEFIHGCSKRGCRGNILHMNNKGRLVYPAAACGTVLDIENNTQQIFNKHTDDVVCIAKHPNGDLFATGQIGRNKNDIFVWSSSSPSEPLAVLETFHHFKNAGVIDLCFSKDGTKLAAVGGDVMNSTLVVYEWQSQTLLGSCKAHSGDVYDLSFSSDDSKILLCGKNSAKFFELTNGLQARQAVFSPRGVGQTVYCTCYDPSGNPICGVKDGSLYAFVGNKLVYKKDAHSGACYTCYRTENGFITGGRDGKVIWWEFTSEQVEGIHLFRQVASLNLVDPIQSVVPSNVERDVVYATRGNGDLVKITNKMQVDILLVSHVAEKDDELWGLCTIPGSNLFLSAADDGRLIMWDLSTHKHVQQLKVTTKGELRSVAFSPELSHIATATKHGTLFVYNFDGSSISSQPFVNEKKAAEEVAALQYSPDGTLLALGSHDNFIYILNTSDYSLKFKLVGHSSFVTHIDFSSDGKWLRSNSGDYEALLWDMTTGKQVVKHGINMEDIDWHTVTCSLGWKVRGIWKTEMDGTDINAVDVFYGKQLLASADDFGTVTLFHYPTASLRPPSEQYIGHCSHVTNVRFTSDGKYLLSAGGADITICQWRIL